ncbi:MAG: sulfurtransferase TusA family protein [Ketobacteraceae bacterium]|nr:sulfurtransferase TusA family protein [Ketobacteraceae bacterium]
MSDIAVELDARGLTCPMPLLKLKQHLNRMEEGQLIRVQTTDPGSVRDFAAFLKQVSSELIDQNQNANGEYCFLIRK